MTQPKVAIAITASDQTARGWASAERRAASSTDRIGKAARSALDVDRGLGSGRGLIRTFAGIERAAGGAFRGVGALESGGGSLIAQFARMRGAASLLGRGLGGAATEAVALEAGIVGIGAAAAVTGGTIVGLAAGMAKLADGWGKGAANLGNMASLIGVSTAGLQKFAGAAERVGVDKATAMGTLGSLSGTLNDARYGRNSQALAILGKLGVKLQTNADGTVDTERMLPAIATALAAQNSSGRRTAASALGIPLNALPAFAQGGKALASDMADYGRNGAVLTDKDVALGRDLKRRDTTIAQRAGRMWSGIQRGNAGIVKGVGDAIVGGSGYASPIGEALERGAKGIGDAIVSPANAAAVGGRAGSGFAASRPGMHTAADGHRTLRLSQRDVEDLKKVVQTEWNGRSVPQGHGIIDTILNRRASGHFGESIGQIVDQRKQFSNINGPVAWKQGRHSVSDLPHSFIAPKTDRMVNDWLAARSRGAPSSIGSNLNYANPYGSDPRNLPWINALDGPVFGAGKSIHRHGTAPENQRYRPGEFGVSLPTVPVHVTVEVSDKRVIATATHVGKGSAPRVSHAFGETSR